MLTTRVLPRDEWHRLQGMDLAIAAPHLRAISTDILVIEDDGVIVGCWALVMLPHVEGVWIAPPYRKQTSVARRLWRGMKALIQERGCAGVLTAANSPDVHHLMRRATPMPQEYLLCL